jgi:hypothetical protein
MSPAKNVVGKVFTSLLLIAPLAAALGSLAACQAPSSEDPGASEDEIRGSLSSNRACAVRDAYLAADLSDFTVIGLESAPASLRAQLEADGSFSLAMLATFQVPVVGRVFVAELEPSDSSFGGAVEAGTHVAPDATKLIFWDEKGYVVLSGEAAGDTNTFALPTARGPAPLSCSSRAPGDRSVDAGLDARASWSAPNDAGQACATSADCPSVDGGVGSYPAPVAQRRFICTYDVGMTTGRCVRPGTEGGLCGGTFSDFSGGECDPGLRCIGPAGQSFGGRPASAYGGAGRCVR